MQNFSSPRVFSPWMYIISHGQLLIRSAKCNDYAENVDLKFLDVLYMDLPSVFYGLSLDSVTEGELKSLVTKIDAAPEHTVYVLCSASRRYIVAAYSLTISTNRLNYSEPGF